MAGVNAPEIIYLIEERGRGLYAPIALLCIKLRRARAAPPEQLDRIMLRVWSDPCGTLERFCEIARKAGIDARICWKLPEYCRGRSRGR